MVRVDADVFLLGAEGELAAIERLQLVVGLQVRPAPHPAVDDVGQTLPVGHLQPPVQRARNRHTLAFRLNSNDSNQVDLLQTKQNGRRLSALCLPQ